MNQNVGQDDSSVVSAVPAAIRFKFLRFAVCIDQRDQHYTRQVVNEAHRETQTHPNSLLSSDNLLFL